MTASSPPAPWPKVGLSVALGRSVAVKVLLPELASTPDLVARLLREGRAAARLTSVHAAKVYEVGLLDEWGMGEFWHEDSEICLRAALAGWLSFTVRFPWEHKYHSSYKAEKGAAWMEKFQANLDYIRKLREKVGDDRIGTVKGIGYKFEA